LIKVTQTPENMSILRYLSPPHKNNGTNINIVALRPRHKQATKQKTERKEGP